MSVERHRRVKQLFLAACEIDPAERSAWLDEECGADRELRAEVEEMLGVDESDVSALATPAFSRPSGAPPAAADAALPPDAARRLAERAAARPYVVQGELARGGMGAILQVRDGDLGRDLAMKVSLRQLHGRETPLGQGSAGELARFLEEAQITAQLDHPGIVPVHDLGIDAEGRLFFTMKLVQGRDLGAILERARDGREGWTRTRVVGVLQKVCDAMAYAHDKGVVHRDLKPANVMVGEYGEVYVMDWGIARVLRDGAGSLPPVAVARSAGDDTDDTGTALHTRAGAILGTPHAMPPEQARGEPVGPQADVYAVGAMLYRLLAGRRPYESTGEDVAASVVLARVLRGPPEPLAALARDAPAELIAIAERAMAPRVADRYPDMRALSSDLRAYLEGRVVSAYRTGATAELWKWIARNRLAAAGIAATIVAVVAGLAWSLRLEAANRHELDLASDYFRARVMTETADELWPAAPETIPALADWIARAEALLARREVHARRLRGLEASAGGAAAPATETERQRALLAHIDALDGGTGGGAGLLGAVRARLEFARTIEERSLTGASVAERWHQARASIRAGSSHPLYAGLDLAPQLGLVPLAPDMGTGLWEFAHLESGAPPERDADGALVIVPETGLVFALLPGGTFRMGSTTRAGEPNYDDQTMPNEMPAVDVTLAPFFLSKYEMTQAQWERCAGRNPSKWPAGIDRLVTPTNPVEQVSWSDATAVLGRMGLVLPTEARWEYACRAGSDTPFACDPADLSAYANLADRTYRALFTEAFDFEPFTDGFAYHAPVGRLQPNDFGLHDVHGNVCEWVLDHYGSSTHPRRAGDGLSLGPPASGGAWWSPDYHIVRGGFFEYPRRYARSAHRVNFPPAYINHGLGVRPAREIEAGAER